MRDREAQPAYGDVRIVERLLHLVPVLAALVERLVGQLGAEVGIRERFEQRRRQILRQIEPLREHVAHALAEVGAADFEQHDVAHRIDEVMARFTAALERGEHGEPEVTRDAAIRRWHGAAALDLEQRTMLLRRSRRAGARTSDRYPALARAVEELLRALDDVAVAAAGRRRASRRSRATATVTSSLSTRPRLPQYGELRRSSVPCM